MDAKVVWEHPTDEYWVEVRDDGKYYAIATDGCQRRRSWDAGIVEISDTIDKAISAVEIDIQRNK